MRSRGEVDNEADHMLSMHEAVAEVEEAEEKFLDEHRNTVQAERDLLVEEDRLLAEVDRADYDIEIYVKKLDAILNTKLSKLSALQGRFEADSGEPACCQ